MKNTEEKRLQYNINNKISTYKNIEEIMKEELKNLEFFKKVLKEVKEDVPSPSEIVITNKDEFAVKLKKTGTTLILTAPVPVVSDLVGASLFAAGVLVEYKKRKRIQEMLTNYIEFINENVF